MSSVLKTKCPACEKKLRLADALIGKTIRCPVCKHRWKLENIGFSSGQSLVDSPEALETMATQSISTEGSSHSLHKKTSDKILGKLGRFEIKEALGGGAFGIVYKAWDPTLRRMIALKVPKFGADEPNKLKRFLIEAHAAANLHHPNIVAVYESGQAGDKAFIAAEYVDGTTLSACLTDQRPPFHDTARWVQSLAAGLAYAHKQGVVHRDVKPENILMGSNGRPQLTDFGLAKLTDDDSQLTGDGSLLGTPAYMSPEQARGELENIGPCSDQYSLGVVLYELLSGKRPFDGAPHRVVSQVASEEPPGLRALNSDIPSDLAAICQKAMEKEIDNRYADMTEMAEDLARWQMGHETYARPLSTWEKGRRWYRKNPAVGRLWLAVGALLIVVLALGAVDYTVTKVEYKQVENNLNLKTVELNTAEELRLQTQRSLVINEFERGRRLCEGQNGLGDIKQGLLWLSESLVNLDPEMKELEAPIRHYIGSWLPHLHRLKQVIPFQHSVNSIAISDDGKKLLVGTGRISDQFGKNGPGSTVLWNLETGQVIGESIVHSSAVTQVGISADGRFAVSASLDRTLNVLDPQTGEPICAPIKHPDRVISLAISKDSSMVATACMDTSVRIWDTRSWKQIGSELHHERPHISRLAFTPEGKSLLTGIHSPGHFYLVSHWDIKSGTKIELPTENEEQKIISFTSDGQQFLSQTLSREMQFFDVAGSSQDSLLIKRFDDFIAWDFHRTSHLAVMAGDDRTAWIYDLNNGRRTGQRLRHSSPIFDVAFSPDGQTVYTAGRDRLLKIWQVSETRPWGIGRPHEDRNGIAFLPDGNSFLASDSGNRDRKWNATTFELEAELGNRSGHYAAVDWFRAGNQYVRGSQKTLSTFNTQTGKQVSSVSGLPAQIWAVKCIDSRKLIVVSYRGGRIHFRNSETLELIKDLKPHKNVTWLAVSPNEEFLVTASRDGTALIWNLDSFEPTCDPLSQAEGLSSAAFHPSGKFIATSGSEGSVFFWSVPDGKPMGTPIHNVDDKDGVCDLSFSADGNRLLTIAHSQGAQLWDLKTSLPASRRFFAGTWWRRGIVSPDKTQFVSLGYGSGSNNGREAQLWHLPGPAAGSPELIRLLVETSVGMEIGEENETRVLGYDEWKQKRDSLSRLMSSTKLAP